MVEKEASHLFSSHKVCSPCYIRYAGGGGGDIHQTNRLFSACQSQLVTLTDLFSHQFTGDLYEYPVNYESVIKGALYCLREEIQTQSLNM